MRLKKVLKSISIVSFNFFQYSHNNYICGLHTSVSHYCSGVSVAWCFLGGGGLSSSPGGLLETWEGSLVSYWGCATDISIGMRGVVSPSYHSSLMQKK